MVLTFPVATELFAIASFTDFSCDLFGHGRSPDVEFNIALVCWQTSRHRVAPKGRHGRAAYLCGLQTKVNEEMGLIQA